VTFRTLAVAAMIVLTLAPEALVHPSFQMSFAEEDGRKFSILFQVLDGGCVRSFRWVSSG
jgi:Competence protein